MSEFNWLNFFITEEEKLKMFIRGAEAACDFLMGFDWIKYQEERINMQIVLNEKAVPEAIIKAFGTCLCQEKSGFPFLVVLLF